jgi:hypothetical protein
MPRCYSSGGGVNKAKTKKIKSRKQKKVRSSRKMRKSRKNKYYSQNQEGGGWWPSLFRRSSRVFPYYQDESGHAEPIGDPQIFTLPQQYTSTIKKNRQEIKKIITSKGIQFARMLTAKNIDYGTYMGSSEPYATLVDDLFEEDVQTRQALEIIKYYSELYDAIQESKVIYGGSLA